MRFHLIGWMVAGVLTATVAAQNPPSQGLVTVEGCLARKADAETGTRSTPNRVDILDTFVLMRTKVIKGTAPPSITNTYAIEDIDAGLLASYVGQRVQIDGWFFNLGRATSPSARFVSDDDLVEIRGHAIRAIAKDCGAP